MSEHWIGPGAAADGTPSHVRAPATVCVGIDLVHIPEVASSIAEFGDRYLRRVYSAAEIATCTGTDGVVSADRLAARFAAKEAVIKALRPAHGVDYRTIEVIRGASGVPTIAFTGTDGSGRLLAESGIVSSSVSLTHDGDYASAVFIAITDGPSPETPPTSSHHPAPHIHGGPR